MSIEKKAVTTAFLTAFTLTVTKFIVWIFSWSMVVISSAIDSLLDFFVSWVNFFAIKKSQTEEDDNHNYGYGKIEWLWALFEWSIITVSWLSIIYFAIQKIINGEKITNLWDSIWIMAFSIVVTFALVIYLNKVAKASNNLIIRSDALHYKTDLYTNFWIIISLIIIKFTWFYLIDWIVSILIAIYIIVAAFGIIKEWYYMLMDRSLDDETLELIKWIITNTDKRVSSYHFLKTRASGKYKFIEFHIVLNKDISLLDAHKVGDIIECRLRKEIPNSKVLVHLDPFDDSHIDACIIN